MKNLKNNSRIISVKVITNSKKPRIEDRDGCFTVWVSDKPHDGKANEAVIKSISDYFDVAKTSVRILRGEKARIKILEIIG